MMTSSSESRLARATRTQQQPCDPCWDVARARVRDSGHLLVMRHLEQLLVNVRLVEADVHGVPGGHHVVVVHHLQQRRI